ncbi:MAG: DeoR/GlpR family DNA-binding transcription regulator [Tepidisphaeraceae bacterium]
MTDLIADARRRRIIDRIRRTGTVRVVELAGELSVAEETVRRDLRLLDQQGILIRTHGGAVRADHDADARARALDIPFEQRRQAMLRQKRAIAAEAAKRVSGGITIALDGSTTAWELAAHLDDPSLTIVTNSLMVTTLLASKDGPQVISVGGTLDRKLMMFTGMIAREGLRHVHVDLFFCSCGGIDPTRGFSDPSEPSAQFKRQLMHTSDRTILLADSTKFEMRSPVMFASPADVVELITDAAAPGPAIERLQSSGLHCTLVSAADGQD